MRVDPAQQRLLLEKLRTLPDEWPVADESEMSSAESAEDRLHPDDDGAGESSSAAWLDRAWIWPVFGLIAVLVFELTANPGLAVAIFCAKLGLKDVRLGLWLSRRDPIPERGQMTGLIAASMIGLKVTVASLVTYLSLLVISCFAPLQWNAAPALFQCGVSLGITTGVCLVLSLTISSYAFFRLLRTGQKVWLEEGMTRAPGRDEWPPEVEGPPTRNSAIDVAQLGFLMQIPVVVTGGVWLAYALDLPETAMVWIVFGGIPVVLIACYLYLRLVIVRAIARHPGQCWPELTEVDHQGQ